MSDSVKQEKKAIKSKKAPKTKPEKNTKDNSKNNNNYFAHLHLHTEYSMLDGLIKPKELMPLVKEYGMDAVAITDHGVMHGVVYFFTEAKANGIKPILGVEAYLAEDYKVKKRIDKKQDGSDKMYFHLTLLAKNFTGYKNLLKLVSIANTEGFYYKPRIDKKLLQKYKEGLIALSGCYGGELAQTLFKYKKDKNKALEEAVKVAKEYKKLFGEDYYIEIQRGTSGKEAEEYIDPLLIEVSKQSGIPLVATNDTHYIYPEDAKVQEILWAVNTGKKVDDPDLFKSPTDQLYLKKPEEMYAMFSDIPEAVYRTKEIVDKVEEYSILFDRIEPKYFAVPEGKTSHDVLREKAYEGTKERYGEITKEIKERIDYELKVIHDKGYDDYFLIVADYINWAKNQGILVGPGRGSGAGSVVAYTLKITNIDPFWWGLEFERFLNPHRPSPPDFDVDFQDDRRDEVIKYIEQRYGKENVAAICAIGRMDTKAAIRDVSRVLGIPLELADKVAKLIPVKRGKPMPIQEALEVVPELKELVAKNPELDRMIQAVSRIKKLARHVSVHACGYVITPTPLTDYLPLRLAPQDQDLIITQIEGKPLEKIGLMKYDFLGLRTLTIIKNTLNAIKKHHGKDLDIDKIPLDDDHVFKVFRQGKTDAVFQFESQGMKSYLRELKPSAISDINFMCAAYRPGPMKYIPDYIRRKHGEEKTEYLHPDLKPILEETYGIAVYQEQVLRIAVVMAGYSVGEADILRRAIGKKEKETLLKEKDRLIKGMLDKGYSKEVAQKVWEYMLPFAEYGFNKSHSASYALIAYQTAYLKAYYPVEFVVGLLQTDQDRPDRLEKDLEIALKMKIKVLPPHINKSEIRFTIEDINKELEPHWLDSDFETKLLKSKKPYLGLIRYGFGGIKGVSSKAVEEIIRQRHKDGNFKHMDDLLYRVDLNLVDKKSLILLAKAGAFDNWGERNAVIALIERIYDRYKSDQKRLSESQMSLMGAIGGQSKDIEVSQTSLPEVEPASVIEILNWEKSLFGIYLSSHPLMQIREYLRANGVISIKQAKRKLSEKVKIAVTVKRVKKHTTKKGDLMAFLEGEDHTDTLDIVVFPRVYEKFAKEVLLNIDLDKTPLILEGVLDKKVDKYSFILNKFKVVDFEKAKKLQKELEEKFANLDIKLIGLKLNPNLSREDLAKLREILQEFHNGKADVIFLFPNGKTVKYKYKVNPEKALLIQLKDFGEVKLK